MMDNHRKYYSARLGELSCQQLQQALDVFELGALQHADPIKAGNFGQNMYITSSQGAFVLRGAPYYAGQFHNERFFANQLHEKTQVPVPWPYLLSDDESILGWPFVLMPRMPGRHLSDDLDDHGLSDADRLEIAQAQGRLLAEAQKLVWPFCGKYDHLLDQIVPYQPDYITWLEQEIVRMLTQARQYNTKTPDRDITWANDTLTKASLAMREPFQPVFVMQDYKPGNMVVTQNNRTWSITGLFDLMTASFGHGESDLSRLYCVYLDGKRPDLACAFLKAYLGDKGASEALIKRFAVFILFERATIWEWAQRTHQVWWDDTWTFRTWTEPYTRVDVARI